MFNNVLTDVEGVFGSSNWTTNNIKTIPANYHGELGSITEYVSVNVLPSNSNLDTFGVTKKLTGLVAIKMFVPAGYGQRRIMQVGDLIDNVLQYKTLALGTRLDSSYITVEGLDPRNEALYSASYFIPFTIYGE